VIYTQLHGKKRSGGLLPCEKDALALQKMAEGTGFEPAVACATTVFKTVTIDHSDTPPGFGFMELFLT
jgi:hypothetical protein